MNKLFVIGVLGLLLVGGVFFSFDNNEEVEDIGSYGINNRYDCYKIKDNVKYNDCVKFYLKNNPYKLGDEMVSIRPIE